MSKAHTLVALFWSQKAGLENKLSVLVDPAGAS